MRDFKRETYSESETIRRREDALKRMLNVAVIVGLAGVVVPRL
jgi:hypothetical protein